MNVEVEKHVRYVVTVKELTEAWAFIMEHTEEFARPSIEIQATSQYDTENPTGEWEEVYIVVVSGSVK